MTAIRDRSAFKIVKRKKLMTKFLSPILLKDEFVFNGTIDELNEKIRLNNHKKFRTEWLKYDKFKFFSNLSLGTLQLRGFQGLVEGIKGVADLTEINGNRTKVEMTTKVRIELYFFLTVLLIICTVGFATQTDFPIWLFLFVPLTLLWFWFVNRVQEKILFANLKKYLMEK